MRKCTMEQGLFDVWQTIGRDILQSWDCPDGESPTLTGEEVASVTYDYAETYLPKHLVDEWRSASHEQQHIWLEKAFPKSSLYGY